VNCASGNVLAEEQTTATSKGRVLDALGTAVTKLRGELGESLAQVRKADMLLEQLTTPSLEALQAYTLGSKAQEVGKGASRHAEVTRRAWQKSEVLPCRREIGHSKSTSCREIKH
jgi:hypothetical protein